MKLLSYESGGKASYGVVSGDGVVDLGRRLPHADLRALIAADAFDEARAAAEGQDADAQLDAITYLPTIPNPDKVICVGLNYLDHRAETGRTEETANPTLFTRFVDAQTGHGQPMIRPSASDNFDFEGELAVWRYDLQLRDGIVQLRGRELLDQYD